MTAMKSSPFTKLSDLAYLIVLSLLIIFLVLALASLCPPRGGKDIPHGRLLLAVLLFGLGYLSCLYLSRLIFSPLKRLIGRSKGRETVRAGSSLRELMEDLRVSREEAKKWNQELGQMASSIAHEIRNPLAIISTAGGYLKKVAVSPKPLGGSESSQVQEQLGIIDREIGRVGKIVDGLLRFSRASTSPSHPELVNINEMAEEALSQLSQGGGLQGGIEVAKNFTPSLPRVRIDPAELQQAFLNIIQNACQAMPNGGDLTIATRLGVEPNCLEISFTDTGCGIAEENMEKVFQPFFTSKNFGEGTGLGLAIAEGIVKRAGGKIKAESKPEKDTVFTIYLPI